jgi:hypothetical protein
MIIATREDFEPQTEAEHLTAMYTSYMDYPFFEERVNSIKGRFAPNNQKVAVWGCGWGYLVQKAVAAGYDAYGFDASPYAIQRGKELIPSIANRLFVRNALNSADMTPARRDAGIQGNARFTISVSEDMLTCLTDNEITTALVNMRSVQAQNVPIVHVVWPLLPDHPERDPRINWKSVDQWRSILCPPDIVYDAERHELWNEAGRL